MNYTLCIHVYIYRARIKLPPRIAIWLSAPTPHPTNLYHPWVVSPLSALTLHGCVQTVRNHQKNMENIKSFRLWAVHFCNQTTRTSAAVDNVLNDWAQIAVSRAMQCNVGFVKRAVFQVSRLALSWGDHTYLPAVQKTILCFLYVHPLVSIIWDF